MGVLKTNTVVFLTTCLVFFFASTWTPCDGVGSRMTTINFCYDDPRCGPDTWGGMCKTGRSQSPIDLPGDAPELYGGTPLDLSSYRSKAFRMLNNGHTVNIEFLGSPDISNRIFTFPMPSSSLARYGRNEGMEYRLNNAHFHWGGRDEEGSEHCIDHRCFSMEMHLVHFLRIYRTMEDAVKSGDKNAFAVIAVVLDVSPAAGPGNPVLAPIMKNLVEVVEPSTNNWRAFNTPLDLTPLLRSQNYFYTYRGSLTTPNCTEQVNWFVFRKPIPISHNDVVGFRMLKERSGNRLTTNHRPIQNRNGRFVYVSAVNVNK